MPQSSAKLQPYLRANRQTVSFCTSRTSRSRHVPDSTDGRTPSVRRSIRAVRESKITMPYTYRSLAFAWLIVFALLAVSSSGVVRGWWFAALVAAAVAVPSLVLRRRVAAASPERVDGSDRHFHHPSEIQGSLRPVSMERLYSPRRRASCRLATSTSMR